MTRLFRTSLILILAGIASVVGCSDDENPAGPTTGHGRHPR
jgi:hypothetical protein